MTLEEARVRCIFESLVGSRLYGMHEEDSDYDYKGVFMAPDNYYFGMDHVNQVEQGETTLYELRRFLHLAGQNNPNILELLWIPEEHWKHVTVVWKTILESRDLLMSKKVKHTYSGYAFAQLRRIKTHKKYLLHPLTHEPTREEFGLPGHRDLSSETMNALLVIDPKCVKEEFVDLARREKNYSNAKREWDHYVVWQTNRNPARAALEEKYGYDVKHAAHLVRLMRQGQEALEMGNITVDRRGVDADELKAIRNGAWSYDKIIEYCDEMDRKLTDVYEKSSLQYSPDHKKIGELCHRLVNNIYGRAL